MATRTTGQVINNMPAGVFKTLEKVIPMGALQARKQTNGTVSLHWRYSIGIKSERVTIGTYDSSASPKSLAPTAKGFSIAAANNAAQVLAQAHHNNRSEGGRPALIAAEAEAKRSAAETKAHAISSAAAIELAAAKFTVKNLLNHYCDHLESLGRSAHKDARSIFKLHVYQAWPKLANLPANQLTGEQVADMMRRVLESGKGRTSNKLRSYVRAAYQTARAARSKASIPLHFKAYSVSHNPAGETEPDESQNKPDKNPLTAEELRNYWLTIKSMPGFKGAVLRLHLLTGGQRIEQLVNLLSSDISSATITLHDGKGRPGKAPRPHMVPMIPLAVAALQDCKPQGVFAISTDGGKSHLSAITLSHWACAAAFNIPGFKTKRIRSGVETLLASARIISEIRGRLQSHGISGVQVRHYDGHEYMEEKRQALDVLFNQLER
jgi:integrase